MKKLSKYLRQLLILVGWTAVYLWIVSLIMGYFWHFNIFEKRYWLIISEFWSAGGVIDQPSEYMFLLMLILIVPGWFIGWKKAQKLSYVKIIFFPVFWYNDYVNRKYAGQPTRIVLKNMGGGKVKKQSPQQMMEEMISSRMPQPTEKKDLNSSKIRSVFEQKNRAFHEKVESGDK